jgi:two-component system, chemotaxis family, sensor histidine kinase and response regulator PixL
MITDLSIREQGYAYFLSEAPELLQIIEQELYSLSQGRSTAKVHNLMRATHTIKGGAANVGLDVINKVAHYLEDVFKALYNPDVEIDAELQNLLLQAYECLRLPLTAELTGTVINDDELLQRAANVFAHLQENLGDALNAESYIPTSEELGFDIVQSVFEVGVEQRIESIVEIIKCPTNAAELTIFLHSQAEVFVGLAESLNLPGFGEIAKALLAALSTNPTQVYKIAEIALADLLKAREAVLAGDRTRGGEPSPALQKLSFPLTSDDLLLTDITDAIMMDKIPLLTDDLSLISTENLSDKQPCITSNLTKKKTNNTTILRSEIEELYKFLIRTNNSKNELLKPVVAKFYLKVIRYIFGWFNHNLDIPEQKFGLSLLIPKFEEENPADYLESWLNDFIVFLNDENDSQSLCLYRQGVILTILLAVAKFQYSSDTSANDIPVIQTLQKQIANLAQEYKNYPAVTAEEKNWIDNPKLQKLLEIKDIFTTVSQENESFETTSFDAPSDTTETLVESIWGTEVSSNFDDEFETSQTEEEEVNSDHSSGSSNLGYEIKIKQIEEVNSNYSLENSQSSKSLAVSKQQITDISETVVEIISDLETKTKNEKEDKSQISQTHNSRQRSFVRVDVEGLQSLNYLAGELLIYLKRRTSQDDNLKEIVEQLAQQLTKHQTTLNELRDLPLKMQNFALQQKQNVATVDFDYLEMDEYTDFHLILHSALEETLQLQETTDSLDLLLRQSTQIHDKQQRLVLNIIDNLVEARMSPLGTILNRFTQMVQNLGNVYSKKVEVKLSGTGVLVDKAIAEKLYEPLLHIVRNAFDHGIEPAEVRRERGKREQGLIEIRAYHQGNQTIIEVKDDGEGLKFEKIHKKGIELGLLPPNDTTTGYISSPTEEDLLELLFAPGFSTAGKVSEISGRGMGLDIVRSQLESLDGSIALESLPNQGTTFILKIPFSMTTDQLMLVQAGGAIYALLLDSIDRILIPSAEQIKEFEGKKVLYWNTGKDERMVSLRPLSDLIYYNGSFVSGATLHNQPITSDIGEKTRPVLLLRRNQEILGLEVDQIIGEQELVIRPLGNAIAPPKYVYGCSSLANGTLILVIDGALLLATTEMQATLDTMSLPFSSKKKALQISGSAVEYQPLLAPSASNTTQHTTSFLASNKGKPKVVLVVDDAISLRQTLSLTLQKSGYQVVQAQNGAEALEQLQRHPEVDVVISDLEMPRMNGFEFLSTLRQNPELTKKPVIILTSRSAEKHRQLAQALGANAYLIKPYLEHEFLNTVEGLIRNEVDGLTQLILNH